MYQSAKYPPILRRANRLNEESSSSPPLIAMLLLTSVVEGVDSAASNADLDDCCTEDEDVARATAGVTPNVACLAETVAARRARATIGERIVEIGMLVKSIGVK